MALRMDRQPINQLTSVTLVPAVHTLFKLAWPPAYKPHPSWPLPLHTPCLRGGPSAPDHLSFLGFLKTAGTLCQGDKEEKKQD